MKLRAVLLAALMGCGTDDIVVPVRPAPPSHHEALEAALVDDAKAFAFADGDWLEDRGDAAFYGAVVPSDRRDAALARARTLILGDPSEESVLAAFGLSESSPELEAFLGKIDAQLHASGDYLVTENSIGPTAATAAIALLFLQNGRTSRARDLMKAIEGKAFGDLVGPKGGAVRGYAFAPGDARLLDTPTLAMLLLKTRLFRVTKSESLRLECRSLYVALRALESDGPLRYTPNTLATQNYAALALMNLFDITGDQHFIDEADATLDAVANLRGAYCIEARCASGLLHHLALDADSAEFCSGCSLQTSYVLGVRRALANE